MTTNNPNSSPLATTSSIPSGLLPSGTTGVTVVPIAQMWDANFVNPDGSTGAWRHVPGTDGQGMAVVVVSLPALPSGSNTIGTVNVGTMPNVTVGSALPAGTNTIGSTLQAGLNTYDSDNGTPVSSTSTSLTITPSIAFNHISIYNTGTNPLQIKVGSGKWITIQGGQPWDAPLSGTTFSHQSASGTTFDWMVY